MIKRVTRNRKAMESAANSSIYDDNRIYNSDILCVGSAVQNVYAQ